MGSGVGQRFVEGVVITPTEADEAEIAVVQAASETDRDAQIRVGILNDSAERVSQDFLYHVAGDEALWIFVFQRTVS